MKCFIKVQLFVNEKECCKYISIIRCNSIYVINQFVSLNEDIFTFIEWTECNGLRMSQGEYAGILSVYNLFKRTYYHDICLGRLTKDHETLIRRPEATSNSAKIRTGNQIQFQSVAETPAQSTDSKITFIWMWTGIFILFTVCMYVR